MTQGEFELTLNLPKDVMPNIQRNNIFESLEIRNKKKKKFPDLHNTVQDKIENEKNKF